MAIIAIAERRELTAAFDQARVETLRLGRIDGRDCRAPGDGERHPHTAKQQRDHNTPDNS